MHRNHIEYVVRKLHYYKTERKDDKPPFNPTGDWYMTSCVMSRWTHEKKFEGHAPMDYNPSMGVKEQEGISTVHCFSCKHKSGLMGTVQAFAREAIPEGLMTKEEYDDLLAYVMLAEEDDTLEIRKEVKSSQEQVPEDVLDCLGELDDDRAIAYAEKRGFTGDDVELFRIGFHDKSQRIMFPIIAFNGHVPLVQGRVVDDSEIDVDTPKYKNYPRGVEKQDYLYGEHLITDETQRLVVVEGMADVVTANRIFRDHQLYPEMVAVGLMGSEPSEAQMAKIRRWGKEVIPFGDNDSPGKLMNKKLQDGLKDYMQVSIIKYPEGTDGYDPDKLGARILIVLASRINYLEHRLQLMFKKGAKQ